MGDLADVDPVGLARAWLLTRDRVTAALGGPDRVGAFNEPPYPMVVLSDPPGDDGDLRHMMGPLLQIEVFGDYDGSPGKPALRRAAYVVVEELALLPDQEYGPGEPVITAVESNSGVGWSPLTGQPRYLTVLRLSGHPGATPIS